MATGTAGAGAAKVPARIVFPVLGPVTYIDDFGDPRPQGPHQGIDIMAPKRALALAAESGSVRLTTSSAGGCTIYLRGVSGTTYIYIHLNNDATKRNDNRGKCVSGTAYARSLKTGTRVTAGQPIGFVGDSGDADGIHPHLHFELHPSGGGAVDPYPALQSAYRLLFSARLGTPVILQLAGTVSAGSLSTLRIRVETVRAWPMGQRQGNLRRLLVLDVPETALVQTVSKTGSPLGSADLSAARKGQRVTVWTAPARATLAVQRGDDLALSAAIVSLKRP